MYDLLISPASFTKNIIKNDNMNPMNNINIPTILKILFAAAIILLIWSLLLSFIGLYNL